MPSRPGAAPGSASSVAGHPRRRRRGAADGRRRVAIEHVGPSVDDGRFPVKRIVGESVRVTAWIHADGHDALAAVVCYRPVPARGRHGSWHECPMQSLDSDVWTASFDITRQRPYEYTIHAWIDRFATWRRELIAKHKATQDVSSELREGVGLLRAAAGRARAGGAAGDARTLYRRAEDLGSVADIRERVRTALDDRLAAIVGRFPDRRWASTYDRVLHVSVDRERAREGAWYEMFPRSWGPDPARSATFAEAEAHLHRIAAMGFDVVYLPPIHPVGVTARKGRGNALTAAPGDPGSPWAIGSEAGGHTAVDPALGTLDDFDHFVGEARRVGLEVALDLAFQCSPDHPYLRDHPEWFRHRPDGTIKHAENPPKKYEDIVPFDFECDAWPALWSELKSIVEFWIARGVGIFRVDNPHTKPYRFWEWLIREVRTVHPDVIFLAEAFTRPTIMRYLAKLGFSQSYTYFTWRNTKADITAYLTELTGTEVAEYFRPNLFANTPDILHAYLQNGGPPAFKIRLILAATLGATYGIYSGFELCENRALPRSEEYAESEKYQYRQWDWDRPGHIRDLVTAVNGIRRANAALRCNDGLLFCETDNPELIAFCKISRDHSNAVLVVVNLDYKHLQHGHVRLPLDRLGLPHGAMYEVVDQIDGASYNWCGDRNYVSLDPLVSVAHVLQLPVQVRDVAVPAGEELGRRLPRQRWFAGKARAIERITVVDGPVSAPAPNVPLPVITAVTYADGGEERYFTPLAAMADAGGSPAVDAFEDDDACRTLVSFMLAGRSLQMRTGRIQATAYGSGAVAARLRIARITAEQSNSCILIGKRYVLKFLRRLEPGPNPELEIVRFLTTRGFTGVAPLAASLEYHGTGKEPTCLALLHGFVANQGSGWDHAAASARQFLLEAPRSAPAGGPMPFLASARTLGQRTADLHLALAADAGDPAFAPEEMTSEDVAAFIEQLRRGVSGALALLAARMDSLAEADRDRARAVLDARPVLEASICGIGAELEGSLLTRVHGDYHLGQVLATRGDFVIIDFEGEPARPLAGRRAKQPPLKDVAGMLRSFSYATYAALLAVSADRGDGTADFEARARLWESSVSAAFLDQYRKATAGTRLAPAGDEACGRWLDALVLEKTLYELTYELQSRPAWVAIPLLGILQAARLAGAQGSA